jgi:antitoxin ParD1/3/4
LQEHQAVLAIIANLCHTFLQEVATMATMNVSIPDQMREWVETQIESGHYSNASDYIRDLIRRDQEFKDKREALIQALKTGEKSGIAKRTIDEIWKEVKTRTR